MMPSLELTNNETEFDDTFEYLMATAQYTLAEPVEREDEVDAFRTFMMYLVVRFKLFDTEGEWDSLAAGLGAEAFLSWYRVRREFRPSAAFALNSKNWRFPPSSFPRPVLRHFRDLQKRVPDRFGALKNMHPFIFATLMLPKVLKEGGLGRYSDFDWRGSSPENRDKGRIIH